MLQLQFVEIRDGVLREIELSIVEVGLQVLGVIIAIVFVMRFVEFEAVNTEDLAEYLGDATEFEPLKGIQPIAQSVQ